MSRANPNGRTSPVFPKALEAAAAAIVPRLQADYGDARNTHATARAVVQAYLTALRSTRETLPDGRYGQGSAQLAAMKVGDVVELPNSSPSLVSQRAKVARKLMNNPDARWAAETVATGVRVERVPDGSKPRPKLTSQITTTLAGLAIGESALLRGVAAHTAGTMHYKRRARVVLCLPDAQWSVEQKSIGTRVTRTA